MMVSFMVLEEDICRYRSKVWHLSRERPAITQRGTGSFRGVREET